MIAPGSVIPLDVTIERDEMLHFLGYPEGQGPAERVAELLHATLREARALVRATGVFARIPVEHAAALGLEPIDATGLVVGLVTVGGGIESRASELIRSGAATEALLMDAAGSAAAEEAADRLGAIIASGSPTRTDEELEPQDGRALHASGPGRAPSLSCRISPGYGKWPMSAQRAIFELLPHRELGVELTPAMLMVPRKSISFAMWLGADARPIAGLSGCARCELESCRYRRSA
jgi:hypothetical protein